jgi:hypothetical protein
MLLNTWGPLNSWVSEVATRGGFSKEQIQARRELRKQLQEQYNKYIDQLVFNLEVEIPSREVVHDLPKASPNLSRDRLESSDLNKIRQEVTAMVPDMGKYFEQSRKRELQMAKVIRERALRKFEEEYLAVLLLAED